MHSISYLFSPRSFIAGCAFLWGASAAPLFAQTPAAPGATPQLAATAPTLADKPCILAGRLNADNQWAPLGRGVTLLNALGERVNGSSQKALDTVRAVRLSEPSLVAQCHGNQPLIDGENVSGTKTSAPAIKPGPMALKVEAIYYPPGRAGGQWVELQLVLPADRLVTALR